MWCRKRLKQQAELLIFRGKYSAREDELSHALLRRLLSPHANIKRKL
jgi:hypothetical protein